MADETCTFELLDTKVISILLYVCRIKKLPLTQNILITDGELPITLFVFLGRSRLQLLQCSFIYDKSALQSSPMMSYLGHVALHRPFND